MDFRAWLRDRVTRKGWSGAEFARRVGVSAAAANKWLNGKTKPTREHIPSIARALELSEQDVSDAVREASYFRGGDSAIMRALNLPPDMTPAEARYLHLAHRAFRQWRDEGNAQEGDSRVRRPGP